MDVATLLAVVITVAVVVGAILTGSDLLTFLNLPGLIIVLGGTFAATLIKFSVGRVFGALRLGVRTAVVREAENPRDLINRMIELATPMRRRGPVALDNAEVDHAFLKKGVQLCADGHDFEVIRKVLTSDIERSVERHEQSERIFRGIGDSAPAFGMIGTLVGLVQMLSNMQDPSAIGPGMAVALLTTLYGALIAYLIALPVADKLEAKTGAERLTMTLILEGVLQIQARQHPAVLAELLEAYLPESQQRKARSDEPEQASDPSGEPESSGEIL